MIKNIKSAALMAVIATSFIASSSFAAAAGDIKGWQKKISKLVARKQVYPRAAMRKELEGRAKVKLSIARDGTITNFELIQSTGHKILDKEVPKLIKRINPLPTPPEDVTDKQLSLVLPVTWRIN
jgi:TonB family protein